VEGAASTVWVGKHSPHNRDILLTGRGKWRELPALSGVGNTPPITGIYSSQVGENGGSYQHCLGLETPPPPLTRDELHRGN
jgi:hypothetical protein